ncbi:MAG: hypothetical protein JW850_23000 [Thermoflexales bacterium]|nr:hypothetical protein [Thermoflexales bacterium]
MDPGEKVTTGSKVKAKAEFVPARWWQALDFIRIGLETMRGVGDPWVDSILARPCSPSSWLEYGYMLDNFWHSDSFFIVVAGERAGILAIRYLPECIYFDAIGLLPKFRRGNIGLQAANFIANHCLSTKYQWMLAMAATPNRVIRLLYSAFGGRRFGLSKTRLTLKTVSISAGPEYEIKRLGKTEANQAWRRWRLDEVEHVAGHEAARLAPHFLDRLPRGKYLALYQDGEEIGMAVAGQHQGESTVELFPAQSCWSNTPTARIVTATAHHLGSTIRYLTLTQTHANELTACESLDFERHREEERHLVIFGRT